MTNCVSVLACTCSACFHLLEVPFSTFYSNNTFLGFSVRVFSLCALRRWDNRENLSSLLWDAGNIREKWRSLTGKGRQWIHRLPRCSSIDESCLKWGRGEVPSRYPMSPSAQTTVVINSTSFGAEFIEFFFTHTKIIIPILPHFE